jgi:glucokinase
MDIYIAADVGGTQIRVALYQKGDTHPVKQKRIPTKSSDNSPLERLTGLLAELWPVNDRVCSIVIAAPGWVNSDLGIVYTCPNIPGWEQLPLAQILQERFNVPVRLGNDANLAALGEWRFGAGRGHHNLIYLTISTGIGGGIITNDRLLTGSHGIAGELGHITVMPDGPLCGCGQRGHLEALASGTAIGKYVADQIAQGVPSSLAQLVSPSGRDISEAAEHGDPLAKAALARAGTYIGHAIANFLAIFNPSIVILGGGVSRSGAFLFDPLRAAVAERILSPEYLHGLTITTAELGDDAGLLGALALAEMIES